jgi:hypothetical protein
LLILTMLPPPLLLKWLGFRASTLHSRPCSRLVWAMLMWGLDKSHMNLGQVRWSLIRAGSCSSQRRGCCRAWLGGWSCVKFVLRSSEISRSLAAAALADGNDADARGEEDHGCKCSGRTSGRRAAAGRPAKPARGGMSASVTGRRRPCIESWTRRIGWTARWCADSWLSLRKKECARLRWQVSIGRTRACWIRREMAVWEDRDGQEIVESFFGVWTIGLGWEHSMKRSSACIGPDTEIQVTLGALAYTWGLCC